MMGRYPEAIRQRLGHEGTVALMEALESSHEPWSDHVLNVASERFDRRLAEECAALRVELHQGLAGVRQEMGTLRVELFKWSFLFWIGQVAVVAGLLTYLIPHR
jgi:hypothetical protein